MKEKILLGVVYGGESHRDICYHAHMKAEAYALLDGTGNILSINHTDDAVSTLVTLGVNFSKATVLNTNSQEDFDDTLESCIKNVVSGKCLKEQEGSVVCVRDLAGKMKAVYFYL